MQITPDRPNTPEVAVSVQKFDKDQSKVQEGVPLEKRTEAISKRAIELQAFLFQAERQGKQWADKQPSLAPREGANNKVYELYSQNEPAIAAFFKGGNDTAKMEKLIWDMAVVLGLEDFFAATKETAVGEMRGGIQAALQGQTLEECRKTVDLDRLEIANGILISLIFGMFDAHEGNIMITGENKIKFFDNTRSMPHSNGYILHGDFILPAYRCALPDLPGAKEDLTPDELESLREGFASIQEKMTHLHDFLHSPQTKAVLQKLPPGWLNIDAAWQAMQERMNRLERAFQEGAIRKGEDLVAQLNPDYKFAFASTFLFNRICDPALCERDLAHGLVGYQPLNEIWEIFKEKGYDLRAVKSWCDDPDLSIDDIAAKIADCNLTRVDPEKTEKILEEVSKRAALDLKDVPREECVYYLPSRRA